MMLLAGRLVVGVLLLILGRRLYWLFVAGVGFMTGLQLAPRLLPPESDVLVVIIAVALALLGALLAVIATKVVIGIVGFAAGGGIAVALVGTLIEGDTARLVAYIAAGVVGAILLLVLFDWALILLSSLAGATLIVVSVERLLGMPSAIGSALIIVLAIVGVLIQARVLAPPIPRVRG